MKATYDTRLLEPGMYFVAIKGERRDGHDFIPQAMAKGAAGVIDGLDELVRIAKARRAAMDAKVIAVTGSSGKTTTKEFLRVFFSALGRTYATEENYNNHIGVPLTIVNAPDALDFLILEMGSNHPGEIAALAAIGAPDVGIVTNVGTAHLEFFLTREGIAREKGAILKAAKEFGVIPAGCHAADVLRETAGATPLVVARPLPPRLAAAVENVLPGEYNQANAALAFTVAERFGLAENSAIAALENLSLPDGRAKEIDGPDGITFIDDTYNANPDAMIAALDAFAARFPGRRHVAILGDMFELGPDAPVYHAAVFDHAAKCGMDLVVAVGETASKCAAAFRFPDAAALKAKLGEVLRPGDAVLLKASHGMRLGFIVK